MSTAFTHGFVASLLTPFAPRGIRRLPLLIVLVTLSVLPDIDVLGFRYGIPYSHPWGHRGMTHSIAFSFLLAVLSTFLFYRQAKPLSRRWFGLLALLFVAGVSHGILDAFTDAGLGVGFFLPFDDTRYFFPWRPLETSPIGVARFFNGDVPSILRNEFVWVWVPTAILAAVVWGIRRLFRDA